MSFISELKNKETDSLLIELGIDSARVVLYSVRREGEQVKEVIIKGEARKQLEVPTGFLNPLLSKVNTKMSFSSGDEDVLPVTIFKETIKETILETMPIRIRQDYGKRSFESLSSIMDKVTIILSPALIKSRVDDLTFERVDSQPLIDGREEGEIHSWVKGEMDKKAEEYSLEIGLLPKDIILTDLKIEEIKIDGYQVNHLAGYTGKIIEFKTISAMIFADYFNEIKSIFEGFQANSKTDFQKIIRITHSGAALEPLIKEKKINGILIEIQERWTQVFVVVDGIITRIVDINCGNQYFSRAIEDRLGLPENEASCLKEDYINKKLSEKAREKVHIIITEAADKWFKKINQQITVARGTNGQPEIVSKLFSDKVLLFGQGAGLIELKMVIEDNWQELLASAPRVSVIDPRVISGWLMDIGNRTMYKDLTGRISNTEDVKILCGLLYDLS